jgi:catechol 2,3-dioxygenase-like lactoylglutathione lyase family enzyme
MLQSLAAVTVLVPSYEDGLAFFRGILGFGVLEDSPLSPNKRWVVVAPSLGAGAALGVAVPSDERQWARVGDQTGGRVGFSFPPRTSGRITRSCLGAASAFWKRRAARLMGLSLSLSIPGAGNGICRSQPAPPSEAAEIL